MAYVRSPILIGDNNENIQVTSHEFTEQLSCGHHMFDVSVTDLSSLTALLRYLVYI